jgi:hypothetical protein
MQHVRATFVRGTLRLDLQSSSSHSIPLHMYVCCCICHSVHRAIVRVERRHSLRAARWARARRSSREDGEL